MPLEKVRKVLKIAKEPLSRFQPPGPSTRKLSLCFCSQHPAESG
jgi:hypothetical protein